MNADAEEQLNRLMEESPTSPKRSPAQALVAIALKDYTFVRGTDGQTYALGPDQRAAMPLHGDESFRRHLTRRYHEETGKVPTQAAKTDAFALLNSQADNTDPVEIYQRSAPIPGGALIDLGRPDLLRVEVTAAGWRARSPLAGDPLFRRGAALGAMPIPTAGGMLGPLWNVLNVHPAARSMVEGWAVATLLPGVATPILLLRGEQGTGKTTAARLLTRILDPSRGQLTAPPRNEREWAVAAAGRTVVGLDNLSTIPPWMSDAFCRAVTGDEVISRKLYTDGEQFIVRIHCALVITSIDPGALRGDLAERLLPIELARIDGNRRRDVEIFADYESNAPSIFAAILDLVALTLRTRPNVVAPPSGWPRMADFAEVLAALDIANGTKVLEAYLQVTHDNEAEVLAGDPVADGVIEFVESQGCWSGTATGLLELLRHQHDYWTPEERRGWRNPKELSGTLRRLAPALRQAGISVAFGKSNGRRVITISHR